MLTEKARCMMVEANMPSSIWNEVYKTSVYAANHIPIKRLNWKTLFKSFIRSKPTLDHIHPFGCRVYSLRHDILKLQKMLPRAQIGYLVGYDSTNIFRIWLPAQERVIRARDVKFTDGKLYKPSDLELSALNTAEAKKVVEILDIPTNKPSLVEEDSSDYDSDTIVVNTNRTSRSGTRNEGLEPADKTPNEPESSMHEDSTPDQLNTPPSTAPPSPPPIQVQTTSQNPTPDIRLQNDSQGRSLRSAVSADYDEAHILPAGTKRNKKRNAYAAILHNTDLSSYYSALTAFATTIERRIHISQLPPEPKSWRELQTYPRKLEFMTACRKEIQALTNKGIFKIADIPEGLINKDLLPLMWVFKYKTDLNGYISKCKKARWHLGLTCG